MVKVYMSFTHLLRRAQSKRVKKLLSSGRSSPKLVSIPAKGHAVSNVDDIAVSSNALTLSEACESMRLV